MSVKKIFLFCIVGYLPILISCGTYYISVDSFKRQFDGLEASARKKVVVPNLTTPFIKHPDENTHYFDTSEYKTYPIEKIECVDSRGEAIFLKNSPSVEIRITENNNKRTIFYFDMIRVNDTAITGLRSRYIDSLRRTIPFSAIKKIEVQNGGKDFRYIN